MGNHTTEPYLVMRGSRLPALMEAAKTRPIEVLVLGSSLHTMSGNGRHFNVAFNRAACDYYGGTPGSPWMGISSFNSGPPGQWCARSSRQSAISAVTGLVSSYAPPDFTPMKATNAQLYGHLLQLDNDNAGGSQGEFSEPGEQIPLGGKFAFEWVGWSKGVATGESSLSTVMKWEATKAARPAAPGYFGTAVASQASIAIPAPQAFGAPGAFDPNNTAHQAAKLWCPSTAGGGPTEHTQDAANPLLRMHWLGADAAGYIMTGVRCNHLSAPFGMRFHFAGVGGAHSTTLLDSYSNCGPTLQAMGPFDIIIVAYTTNSAYSSNKNAATYKANIKSLLDWLRPLFPDAVIGLKSDGYRDGGNSTQDTNFSEMVGANADLVREGSPAEFAINTLLACQRAGFNARSHSMTGKTFKNAWTLATAYSINDVVSLDLHDQTQYFNYIAATAGGDATSKPMMTLGGSSVYTQRFRRWLLASGSPTVAPSDNVHLSPYGDHRMAEIDFKIMLSSLGPRRAGVVRAGR